MWLWHVGGDSMAEYIADSPVTVSLNNAIPFNASIPCTNGGIYHDDGSGIFILRGITNNCFARYIVTFNGNVSIPEDGEAVVPISIGITENGEVREESIATYSPADVDTLGNLTSTTSITVPRGCCFTVAVRYVSTEADPAPSINVSNGSVRITRTA